MENSWPAVKKMRTDGGMKSIISTGEEIDPTAKRKNWNQKITEKYPILETQQFKAENYRGALREHLKKDNVCESYELHKKNETDMNTIYICTCKAGDVTVTEEAKGKKLVRHLAAVALMKKLKLIPAEYKHNMTKERVWKTKKDLLEECDIDEEKNVYNGTVNFWRQEKNFGFISIKDKIQFNGTTAK